MPEEKTVVTTDEQVKPAAEVDDAPDLDTLLAQFDTETEQKETKPPETTETTQTQDPMIQEMHRRFLEQDIGEAVGVVKRESGVNLPDGVVRDLLEGRASRDPRFRAAFAGRFENKDGWNAVLKTIGADYAKTFGSIDASATQTTDEVVAAVQGASTAKPDPEQKLSDKEWAKMSDADFQKRQMEVLRG